jgi:hypothetical protein
MKIDLAGGVLLSFRQIGPNHYLQFAVSAALFRNLGVYFAFQKYLQLRRTIMLL